MQRYQFVLELRRADGARLGDAVVEPDWAPAREWARFSLIRRGVIGAEELSTEEIEPVWHKKLGAPYVGGVRLNVQSGGLRRSVDVTTGYFKDLAEVASMHFVEHGLLEDGNRFVYLVQAFQVGNTREREAGVGFTTEEVPSLLPIEPRDMSTLVSSARSVGRTRGDMPVFIRGGVIDEMAELTRKHAPAETGGILIGHVGRDASASNKNRRRPGDLFLEVTAQIHAREALSTSTRLSFTPATWSGVEAALALRRRGEIRLGWWHSHPVKVWCGACPIERQRVCPLAESFLSADDRLLHRTVFPRAYSIAVLMTDLADGLVCETFGWRRGLLESRGFHIVGEQREPLLDPDARPRSGSQAVEDPEGCVTGALERALG